MQTENKSYYGWVVWFVSALFYLYEFLLRVSPSVMASELMQTLDLTAFGLGSMTAFYFYSYAALQIPVGYIADRIGPKLPVVIACIVCIIFSFLISKAHTVWVFKLCYFMIGCGSAFAFVSTLFLIHSWFPQRQFILLSGLTNFLGILGAIFAQKPLAIYIDSHGWRDAQVLISGIGCIILVLLIVFIKNNNIKKDPVSIKSFNKIISKPVYWLLGLYVGCMHFTLAGFGALWGASYMGIVFHETSVKAAAMASFLYFGSLLGSLFIGFVTKLFRTKTSAMCFISTVGVLSSLAFINIPDVKYLGETLIFIVGFSTSGFLLGYDVVGIITPKDLVGTASGFLNTILVGLSSLSVSLIGYFLVLGATSPHHYSSVDYRHAMIALVVSFSIALITALYLQYKRIDK